MQHSKYIQEGTLLANAAVNSPAELVIEMPSPKKVKKLRGKRSFSVYTYRGTKFLFTYNEPNLATVLMIGPGQKLTSALRVPREKAQQVARFIVRIIEIEREIDSLVVTK